MSKKTKKKVKFKDLDLKDMEYISVIYYDEDLNHNEKMEILTEKFGVTGRCIRGWWERLNLSTLSSRLPQVLQEARNRVIDEDTKMLLVTSAQNKTPIHKQQLASMEAYAKYWTERGRKTQIVVIPLRYRNPTSPTEDAKKKADMWWMPEIQSRLYYNDIAFGDTIISAHQHIKLTAKKPLTGFESLSDDNHVVLGSPRIHFQPQPRFRGETLRVMTTSGCLTRKNYSLSKAGNLGAIHHTYGFVVLELNDDGMTTTVPRNVYVTDDGSFTDLTYTVTPDGEISEAEPCEAIIWGDIHEEQLDNKVYNNTKKLCKKLSPKIHLLHDVYDGYRVNPHERNDMYLRRKKILDNKYDIEDEIQSAVKFPGKVLKKCGGEKVYVIESNHDQFLDRHINDMNWKRDLHNSHTYLKYAHVQQTENIERYGCIYGYLLAKKYKKSKVEYLRYGSKLKVKGFNLGAHGDFGSNGSRGNIRQFSRLNTKIVHGHNHTPIILDGAMSVGMTAKVEKYYTRKGMSTHANAHGVVHANGKRQLLVFDDNGKISNLI